MFLKTQKKMKNIIDNAINNLIEIKNNIDDNKKYPINVLNKTLELTALINALVIVFKENDINEENEKNIDKKDIFFTC